MKNMIAAVVLALVAASAGFADLPTCPTADLSFYVTAFPTFVQGCQIGDKVFYGFVDTLTQGGSGSTAGVGITVDPIPAAGNPGFDFFLSGFSVGTIPNGAGSLDLALGFDVQTLSGAKLIEDASLGIAGAANSGTGQVSINEDVCVGAAFSNPAGGTGCTGTVTQLNVVNPGPPVHLDDMKFITPTNVVGVFKDVGVTSGSDGSAGLSSFTQQFSEVPVPDGGVTLMLLGGALVGLETLRRKLHV